MPPQEGTYSQPPLAAHAFPVNQAPPPPAAQGFPVNQAPTPPFQVASPWSSGLCECYTDVGNCFITCLCPCITFGQIAEIVDRGSTSCGASGALYTLIMFVTGGFLQYLYSCFYRAKLRKQYGLPETPCIDCCVHCCCEACSLCQMYRELKHRGFDMYIGWQANMEKQGNMNMAAPVNQDMRR